MRAVLLSIGVVLAASSSPAVPNSWGGFYGGQETQAPDADRSSPEVKREPRRVQGDALDNQSICVKEIIAAQERHGIPNNLLLAIGLQETGRQIDGSMTVWPYAANAAGVGKYFGSRQDAITWVQGKLRSGVDSIDVGCMQINLRWHPEAFDSVREGYNPAVNVEYAANLLHDRFDRTGDWLQAAGTYHSFTPKYRDRYIRSLRTNIQYANTHIESFRETKTVARTGGSDVRIDNTRQSRGGWSSMLSGAGQDGHRSTSIYSDREIRPILPAFEAVD